MVPPRVRVLLYHSRLEIPISLLEILYSIKEQYIAQLEMLAVLSVYASLPRVFQGRPTLHFVDNQGVLWNLVDASSRDPGCAGMAHSTALLQAQLRTAVWYEYVPSAANIADLPSRGDFSYTRSLRASVGGFHCPRRCVWFESVIPSFGW